MSAPRRYRVALPHEIHTAEGSYRQGDVLEAEYTAAEEREQLDSGALVLEPARYRVVGGSVVFDTQPGEEFERALPLDIEELLVAGAHIERLDEPAEAEPTAAPAKKSTAKRQPTKE